MKIKYITKIILFGLFIFISLNFVLGIQLPTPVDINTKSSSVDNLNTNQECYSLSNDPKKDVEDLKILLHLNISEDIAIRYQEIIKSEVYPEYENKIVCNITQYLNLLNEKLNLSLDADSINNLSEIILNKINTANNLMNDSLEEPNLGNLINSSLQKLKRSKNELTYSSSKEASSQYVYRYDTADYLIGDTYIVLIFVNDSSNKWNTADINYALDRITETKNWIETNEPIQANVNVNYGYYVSSILSDPNDCDDNYNCECRDWMNEALNNIGFYDSHSDGYTIDELNNYIAQWSNSENVYPIFMIHNQGLLGSDASYSCSGEWIPRIALFYYEFCILLCNRHESDAYIHESLHSFSADDEYRVDPWCDSLEDCSREVRWDYPNGNCDYCPGTQDSIMKCCSSQTSYWASSYTKGQIGWGDHDLDSILDPVDNCMWVYNPSQKDTDLDGEGDACDSDDDNDGITDTIDNCPIVYNPDQKDTDHDGIGDVCDQDTSNCVIPKAGMSIRNNTIFCYGTYNIESGIVVYQSNIILDCNSSTIVYNGTNPPPSLNGIAIETGNNNVTIKNCIIRKFEHGILNFGLYGTLNNNKFINNSLIDNDIGVYLLDNNKNTLLLNNLFINNSEGILINGWENIITNNTFVSKNIGISLEDWSDFYSSGQTYNNSIWSNKFYNKGISDSTYYQNNTYCVNGISNYYFNNATGPTCNISPQNILPNIHSFNIYPSNPTKIQNINRSVRCDDLDSTTLEINISNYKNNIIQSSINISASNGTVVSSLFTNPHLKDEKWNFTFSCFDGTNWSKVNNTQIIIANVPIVISGLPDNTTVEDATWQGNLMNLSQYTNDADGLNDIKNYTILNGNISLIICSINNNFVNCSKPTANQSGVSEIEITANDGSSISKDNFTINVITINDIPYWSSIINRSINEDEATNQTFINLWLYGHDVEDSNLNLIYSIISESNTSVVDCLIVNNQWLSCTPQANATGFSDVLINLIDYGGLQVSAKTRVTINPVNDPPIIKLIQNITINENELVNITVKASDVDNNILTYSINDSRFTQNNNIFTWQTNYNDAGIYNVLIDVSDGQLTAQQKVKVTVNDVNRIPSLEIENQTINEDEQKTFKINVSDPDNDVLTLSVTQKDINKVDCILNNYNLTLKPTLNWNGVATCKVKADDSKGGIVEKSFNINVLPVNDAPWSDNINDPPAIDEDSGFIDNFITVTTINNAFRDVEEDHSLTSCYIFSKTSLVVDCVGDPNYNLDCTTQSNQYGNNIITLRCCDSGNLCTNMDPFVITVNNINDAPQLIQNIPDQQWEKNTNLSNAFDLDDYFIDIDGDKLNYTTVNNNHIKVKIDNEHKVTFIPDKDLYGEEIIKFIANDGKSQTQSNNVNLTIINGFFIDIINPKNQNYSERSLYLNISLNEQAKLLEYSYDNKDFSKLCTNCSKYQKRMLLNDGSHNTKVRATTNDNSIRNKEIQFFIDSKDPVIHSTYPRSKSYINKSSFIVNYTEDNLKDISLYINNNKILTKTDCPKGKKQGCVFTLDITIYNNQKTNYSFIIEDVAGNIDKSKQTEFNVDTINPIITKLDYVNNILDIKISEKVDLKYSDTNGKRWSTLCRNCDTYNKKKTFSRNANNIIIKAIDKAGNFDQEIISNY